MGLEWKGFGVGSRGSLGLGVEWRIFGVGSRRSLGLGVEWKGFGVERRVESLWDHSIGCRVAPLWDQVFMAVPLVPGGVGGVGDLCGPRVAL